MSPARISVMITAMMVMIVINLVVACVPECRYCPKEGKIEDEGVQR